jgi:hypothetical protein
MIHCPKCGFEQPQDRFCAKCGIVMDQFTPKKQPASATFGTPLFMFGVVGIFLLGVGGYFIYKSKTSEQYESPAPPPVAAMTEPAAGGPPQQEPAKRPATKAMIQNSAASAGGFGAALPASRAALPAHLNGESAGAAASTTAKAETQEASNVMIEFSLVSRDALEKLAQDSEGTVDIGRYSMGLVPQFKNKYQAAKADSGFKSLASETRGLTLGQSTLVFRGGKEPKTNETMGFFVDITPSRQAEHGTEYKLSIKRTLPEILPTGELKMASQNFDETLNVPHGDGVVIAGLLPRKQLVPGEDELYKSNILRALLDPGFQQGTDEFVVIINPHFSEPTN